MNRSRAVYYGQIYFFQLQVGTKLSTFKILGNFQKSISSRLFGVRKKICGDIYCSRSVHFRGLSFRKSESRGTKPIQHWSNTVRKCDRFLYFQGDAPGFPQICSKKLYRYGKVWSPSFTFSVRKTPEIKRSRNVHVVKIKAH